MLRNPSSSEWSQYLVGSLLHALSGDTGGTMAQSRTIHDP
jgi:hypothetical protein